MSGSATAPGGAIVGFDTATPTATVASLAGGEEVASEAIVPGADGRPRHSPELLAAIERCAEAAGGWEAVGRIAVGIGPGSFTGLRIGIATARALAQGHGCEVAGVCSLDALMAGIAADPRAEGRSPLAAIDARRGQAFAASEAAPDAVLAEPGELAGVAGGRSSLAAGDGAIKFRAELEAAGAMVPPDEDPIHLVPARFICMLGARAEAAAPGEIEPLYLREPDADVWRKRDRGGD